MKIQTPQRIKNIFDLSPLFTKSDFDFIQTVMKTPLERAIEEAVEFGFDKYLFTGSDDTKYFCASLFKSLSIYDDLSLNIHFTRVYNRADFIGYLVDVCAVTNGYEFVLREAMTDFSGSGGTAMERFEAFLKLLKLTFPIDVAYFEYASEGKNPLYRLEALRV